MKKHFSFFNSYYLIIFISAISIMLIILLLGTNKLEKEIEKKMFKVSTEDIISISENTTKSIKKLLEGHYNYASYIKINQEVQKNIEEKIEILITKNIKYAYVLYKDEKGVFRFLSDASKKSEKAFINQKFDVDNPKWFEVYEKKTPTFIKHTLLQELSITYLVPILDDNKVQIVLAIDFSLEKVKETDKIISLMKNSLILVIGISIIFLLTLIYQLIKYKKVEKTAYTDKLTGINNRNFIQITKNSLELNKYVFVVIDIDHFKKINDSFGHDVGDIVLKEFAKTLQNGVRTNIDIVSRYGGEEFLLLLRKENEEGTKAVKTVERIFKQIQDQRIEIDEKLTVNITVSIGINTAPHKAKTFDKAFKLADEALYEAKKDGRNNIKLCNVNKS